MENFQTHLLDEISFCFNILGNTETRIKNACNNLVFYPAIPHYNSNMCQHLFRLECSHVY